MDRLVAPWSGEQVDALNGYQAEGRFHPFTCGRDRGDEAHARDAAERDCEPGLLVAKADGWHCPACGYRQDWAHQFMASPA